MKIFKFFITAEHKIEHQSTRAPEHQTNWWLVTGALVHNVFFSLQTLRPLRFNVLRFISEIRILYNNHRLTQIKRFKIITNSFIRVYLWLNKVLWFICIISFLCVFAGFCGFAVSGFAQEETRYDFGDSSSSILTNKSWEALEAEDYDAVFAYTQRCISLYLEKAKAQQATLANFAFPDVAFDYWALNDVGTCYFIKGSALRQLGRLDEAQITFETVINELNFAQCWDPAKGSFWKVSEAANDMLNIFGADYEFGDYTSQTLTVNSWKSFDNKDYRAVEIYAKRCIQLYSKEAEKQQGLLSDYPSQDEVFDYWALNDVATAHFILAEALTAQKRYKEAEYNFKAIVNNLSFAQCWDPKGWFWSVAVAARERLAELGKMVR